MLSIGSSANTRAQIVANAQHLIRKAYKDDESPWSDLDKEMSLNSVRVIIATKHDVRVADGVDEDARLNAASSSFGDSCLA